MIRLLASSYILEIQSQKNRSAHMHMPTPYNDMNPLNNNRKIKEKMKKRMLFVICLSKKKKKTTGI